MIVALGCDHAGYELKNALKKEILNFTLHQLV